MKLGLLSIKVSNEDNLHGTSWAARGGYGGSRQALASLVFFFFFGIVPPQIDFSAANYILMALILQLITLGAWGITYKQNFFF